MERIPADKKPCNIPGCRIVAQAYCTRRRQHAGFVTALLAAAVVFSVMTPATASPLVAQFFKVKVRLSDGKTVEGYSWGVSCIGGASVQERKVGKVIVHVGNELVTCVV
jgi:hypothetical protein